MTTPTATPSADALFGLSRLSVVNGDVIPDPNGRFCESKEVAERITYLREIIYLYRPLPGDSVAAIVRELRENAKTHLYAPEWKALADRLERLQSAPQPSDPYPWLARGAIPPYQPPFPG